jgi:hypothetical protein
MIRSEDQYLLSATRAERFLASLDTKSADEARWIYHRVIEIAMRPYALVVAGFVMMLFSQRVTGMWLRDAADPCDLIMMPLIGACAGAGISYLWNLRWYDRLNGVFDRRPDLFEDLIEFSLDDPAIARPMARLVKDRAAFAQQPRYTCRPVH